jgi:uncharacterized membrane protein YkoI
MQLVRILVLSLLLASLAHADRAHADRAHADRNSERHGDDGGYHGTHSDDDDKGRGRGRGRDSDDDDDDRGKRGGDQGDRISLSDAVKLAKRQFGADVVRAEARSEEGRTVYHLLLHSEGRVWTVRVDARTGAMY